MPCELKIVFLFNDVYHFVVKKNTVSQTYVCSAPFANVGGGLMTAAPSLSLISTAARSVSGLGQVSRNAYVFSTNVVHRIGLRLIRLVEPHTEAV